MSSKKYEKTNELVDYVCNEITEGRSLRSICAEEGMPSVGTFLRWVSEDSVLSEQYARARSIQMDFYADDMAHIADECPASNEDVQKAKLRIDTRKWIASKLKPKKYGDKIQTEHSGEINIVKLDSDDMDL